MGTMELQSAKRKRRNDIEKLILHSIVAAGVVGAAIVAPNVIGAMGKMGLIPSARQKEIIIRAQHRLQKKGLITWRANKIHITKAGKNALELYLLRTEGIPRKKRWDRRWRIIIFDIPEKRKTVRMRLSRIFREIGLYRLQDSVWVYPHDCEDILTLIKAELGAGRDILYIIADSIENDHHLKAHFSIK